MCYYRWLKSKLHDARYAFYNEEHHDFNRETHNHKNITQTRLLKTRDCAVAKELGISYNIVTKHLSQDVDEPSYQSRPDVGHKLDSYKSYFIEMRL